jgi:polar amino acid transport system substrate-binding protein
MVGFNRRFAPLVLEAKKFFGEQTGPLSVIYRVNAGAIPPEHWTQDLEEGGGRVIGEVCHFVDLLQFLCGAKPIQVYALAGGKPEGNLVEDNVTISIAFEDGSIGTIAYFSTGDKVIPKEYIEVYGAGKTFIIDDFRRARYASGGNVKTIRDRGQDRGQAGTLSAFVDQILGERPVPVPFDELVYTTLATFRVLDSIRTGNVMPVGWSTEYDVD